MSEFPKNVMVSARIHESEKDKLKKSGYSVRDAIEYFNKQVLSPKKVYEVEEHFILKQIKHLETEKSILEGELEEIQIKKAALSKGILSKERIDSYHNIINEYHGADDGKGALKEPFEQFIQGTFIQKLMINELKPLDCPLDEYTDGLLKYYHEVIQVSNTD